VQVQTRSESKKRAGFSSDIKLIGDEL